MNPEQMEAYLAEELDGAGQLCLESTLEGDEALAGRFRQQQRMDLLLRVVMGGDAADRCVVRSVQAALCATGTRRIKARVMDAVRVDGGRSAPASSSRVSRRRSGIRRRRSSLQPLIWTLAAGLMVAIIFLSRSESTTRTPTWVMQTEGAMQLTRQGVDMPIMAQTDVFPGDRLLSTGGTATLSLNRCGSTIVVRERGIIVVGDPAASDVLLVEQGTVSCSVAKHMRGHAFRIATPHAVVTVVGTVFTLTVDDDGTRLHVDEGQVRFRTCRADDAAAVSVTAGQSASIAADGTLTGPEPLAGTPRPLQVVFEEDWSQGTNAWYWAQPVKDESPKRIPGKPWRLVEDPVVGQVLEIDGEGHAGTVLVCGYADQTDQHARGFRVRPGRVHIDFTYCLLSPLREGTNGVGGIIITDVSPESARKTVSNKSPPLTDTWCRLRYDITIRPTDDGRYSIVVQILTQPMADEAAPFVARVRQSAVVTEGMLYPVIQIDHNRRRFGLMTIRSDLPFSDDRTPSDRR